MKLYDFIEFMKQFQFYIKNIKFQLCNSSVYLKSVSEILLEDIRSIFFYWFVRTLLARYQKFQLSNLRCLFVDFCILFQRYILS